METILTGEGYLLLFIISFLASTVIPLGSEWLLATMIASGTNLPATVAIASTGNYLGAVTTWTIGLFGGAFLIRRILKIDEAKEEKAKRAYKRYGSWSLLLSWLPIVGDPLCLVGGMMRVGFARFTLFVFTGKLLRYSAVAWIAQKGEYFIN